MIRRVGVLDYGSGNLHSVSRALAAAGAEVLVSRRTAELLGADALVVPGVGAFAACVEALVGVGGDDLVREFAESGREVLGICVGHQVLFESGEEHDRETAGLGLLPGRVTRLRARRLPHMGWNQVSGGGRLLAGLEGRRFYFVHSYAAHEPPPGAAVGHCVHEDDRFVASVELGPIHSVQFHPEKSGEVGARALRNWLGHG